VVAACAEAEGNVSGGEPIAEACATDDAAETGQGSKWSDLYRDFFGRPPNVRGSCSFNTTCHGSPDGVGAKVGKFACFDVEGCRTSLLMFTNPRYVVPGDPVSSRILPDLLRTCDSTTHLTTGFMPNQPSNYTFSSTAVARIKQWIKDGAPDN
jgi:hypothetical protein